MAFFIMKHDPEHRAYVELAPQDKATFERMLAGNFSTPTLLENTTLPYSNERPAVRYVVVNEKLETGPLRESADYNLRTTLEHTPTTHLITIINSPFPNSKTWIYEVG